MNSFVQVAADGPGKKIQTFESVVGPDTVEAQAVVLVDQFGDPISIEPAGLDQQIQFNDGGAFGASPQLKWDKTFGLSLGDDLTPGKLSLIVQPLIDSANGETDVALFQSDTIGPSDMAYNLYCIQLSANHGGTGRLGVLGGLHLSAASNYGGGSVTSGIGIRVTNFATGDNANYGILVASQSGAAGENRGIYIDTVSGATFNYALQIADQGAGANDYAIKVEGGKSQFDGPIILKNLPTSDPLVDGQLWNNKGILTVSAG